MKIKNLQTMFPYVLDRRPAITGGCNKRRSAVRREHDAIVHLDGHTDRHGQMLLRRGARAAILCRGRIGRRVGGGTLFAPLCATTGHGPSQSFERRIDTNVLL